MVGHGTKGKGWLQGCRSLSRGWSLTGPDRRDSRKRDDGTVSNHHVHLEMVTGELGGPEPTRPFPERQCVGTGG